MLADLLDVMKQAALDAVRNSKPLSIVYGTVTKESPMEITVNQKLILKEKLEQLVFTRNVTDYEMEVTPDLWPTSVAGGEYAHSHTIPKEKVKIKIHNALKKDEQVIMLQMAGGQKYIIMDRMVV